MTRTRLAIALFFFADGLVIGSFAARLPALQHQTGLTAAHLGLALFASSLGALVSMPVAGRLCERNGSRVVCLASLLVSCCALVLVSLADSLLSLALPLFAFGVGFGGLNVAENAQALLLEPRYGRPILSSFHAVFSTGGLIGAAFGAIAAGLAVGARANLTAVAISLAVAGLVADRALLRERTRGAGQARFVRPPKAVLVLGLAAFCCFLAEGAAADWSAVYLSRSAGAGQAVAALGYTTFSLAMIGSRLYGDGLNRRIGAGTMVRLAALLAAAGIGVALAVGSVAAGLVGFAAMGAGLGVIVPVLFRAAGNTPGISASAGIAAVSTVGWLGFLAGPPAIGLVSAAVGLRAALGIVVVAILVLAWLAPQDAAASSRVRLLRRRQSAAC